MSIWDEIKNSWDISEDSSHTKGLVNKLDGLLGSGFENSRFEKYMENVVFGDLDVLCDPSNPNHIPEMVNSQACVERKYVDILSKSEANINKIFDKAGQYRDDNKMVLATLTGIGGVLVGAGASGADYVANKFLETNATYLNRMSNTWSDISKSTQGGASSKLLRLVAGVVGAGGYAIGTLIKGVEDMIGIDPQIGIGSFIMTVSDILGNQMFNDYINGVDETIFGQNMENSWSGPNGFLDFMISNKERIRFAKDTPLDSASELGATILGLPPIFTERTDPSERTYASSFIKDAVYISMTPGFPKYNGSQTMLSKNYYMDQTKSGSIAFDYIKENGLSEAFNEKDKRYYTFKNDFAEYYSYLETMLNTLWIKMGLSEIDGSDGVYDEIFTFFNVVGEDGNINKERYKNNILKERYMKPIGFFLEGGGNITEGISTSTSKPATMDEANELSSRMRDLNYITGFGNNPTNYTRRAAGAILGGMSHLSGMFQEVAKPQLNPTTWVQTGVDLLGKSLERDMGAATQAFLATNGMNLTYPELWSDTSYVKNVSFDFNFVSPYGDPLSIFQYVYVPFFSLLTFAMPRQVVENGLVSPFLVRADVPGLFTSDLVMISDLTWQKGGNDNLWTVDNLPRSISGSFTLTDLNPYLSMTKRLSFLSSNPSYTAFLDNMAGLRAIMNDDEDVLDEYWTRLIGRVSGEYSGMWNQSDGDTEMNKLYSNSNKVKLGQNLRSKTVPWMKKGRR